jgi:hypothetical protein
MRALPDALPNVDTYLEVRVMKDGFVRAGGVDSVPPGHSGRRVTVRLSLSGVWVYLEGELLAEHDRSWVPADVVLHPDHARALRLARSAKRRLAAGDVEVPAPNLAVSDALVGLS